MSERSTTTPPDCEQLDCELERYELREPRTYTFAADRREFVQALGAGLVVLVSAEAAHGQRRGRQPRRKEPLAERLHIAGDGTVTVFTSKVEVGQGSRTQITQAAAEELRLPVEQIALVMADTKRCPDDGGTAGSRTTPSTVPRIRNACAAARQHLIHLAAEQLGVAPSQVEYQAGLFRTKDGGSTTLAQLASTPKFGETLANRPASDVEIRQVRDWKVLGTSVPKVGSSDVVTGRHQYTSDIQLPGMLYGKVVRPPSYGASLESVDVGPAKAMEGVTVVRDGEFIGCAAATSWAATKAAEAIAQAARWRRPTQLSSQQLYPHLKRTARGTESQRGRGGRNQWGDPAQALAAADQRFSGSYNIAYIQHAPMEPRAAVAEWQDGKLKVWTGTQQPSRVHAELREAFRLGDDDVRVIVPDTGGGFGGKHTGEAAVEAARLAKSAGRPVSLRWTREEEFTWAYFRPAGVIDVEAGIDAEGRLVSWDFTNYNSGGSAIDTPYRVANRRTRALESDSPLRQGSYRALASTANNFAREAAMDELAAMAGQDPLDFRLQHLEQGRLRNVLTAAAERFDWQKRRSEGRPVGIACGTEKGSFVAACVEVVVSNDKIRVRAVCQAFECGAIHHPQNLESQVTGCIVMGLGGALGEEIYFEDGQITNASFYRYEVPRMKDLPDLDIVLVDRRDLASVGAGETPIIAVAPAIAGAVYAATGKRLRSMPIRLA